MNSMKRVTMNAKQKMLHGMSGSAQLISLPQQIIFALKSQSLPPAFCKSNFASGYTNHLVVIVSALNAVIANYRAL